MIKAYCAFTNRINLRSWIFCFSYRNNFNRLSLFHFLNLILVWRSRFNKPVAFPVVARCSFKVIKSGDTKLQCVKSFEVWEQRNKLCKLVIKNIELLSAHSFYKLSLFLNFAKENLNCIVIVTNFFVIAIFVMFALFDRSYYLNTLPFCSFQ